MNGANTKNSDSQYQGKSKQNQAKVKINFSLLEQASKLLTKDSSELQHLGISDESIKEAKHDAAIKFLNSATEKGYLLPRAFMSLVLVKFRDERFGDEGEAEKFYNFICEKYEDKEDEEFFVTHAEMMNVYIRRSKPEYISEILIKAQKIFKEYPHTSTLNMLLEGYIKSKKYDEALDLYKKEGEKYRNSVTYVHYLDSLWEKHKDNNNKEVLKEYYVICKQEFDKKEKVHDKILKLYSNKISIVEEIIKEIPEEEKSQYVYKSIINAYCKAKKIEEALKLFNQICDKDDLKLRLPIYNFIINSLYEANRLEDALEIFQKARAKGFYEENAILSVEGSNTNKKIDLHSKYVMGGGTTSYSVLPFGVAFTALDHLWEELNNKPNPIFNVEIVCGKGKDNAYREIISQFLDARFNCKSTVKKGNNGILTVKVSHSQLTNKLDLTAEQIAKLTSQNTNKKSASSTSTISSPSNILSSPSKPSPLNQPATDTGKYILPHHRRRENQKQDKASSNYKTLPCKFFKEGQEKSCKNGSQCKFAHG